MGHERYGLHIRRLAVEAWVQAGKPALHKLSHAISAFRLTMATEYPEQPVPHNVSDFISTWVRAWQERSSVRSKPRSPRPSRLSAEVVDACHAALIHGYRKGRRQNYYRSFKHAVKHNHTIRRALAASIDDDGAPLTAHTLWKRIKLRHPHLARRKLRFVARRTPTEKQARVAYCAKLLSMSALERRQLLARVVWIDAKMLYVVPKGCLVYAPKGADLTVEDKRVPKNRRDTKKIYYYGAVSQLLGAVTITIGTGTSKLKEISAAYGVRYEPYKVMPS
jgi:hypothetical protein